MSFALRPITPSPTIPASRAAERFEETGDPVEWAELYRPNGLHPIHLGDTLKDGRYRIIRKLGYGSFSTVWLAVDTQNSAFVAVKVVMSKYSGTASVASELQISSTLAKAQGGMSGSNHVLQLLDSFEERGPNGTHMGLVYPPMGGTVASMVEKLPQNVEARKRIPRSRLRYPKWMAKRILKHTLLGLNFLHRHGVVHGDLQPGNLLFSAHGIGAMKESDLSQDTEALTRPLARLDGKVDLWAPRHLVLSQQLYEFADLGKAAEIKISDFGAAFFKNTPPAKVVTPVALRAPETILKQPLDENIDIWSFGCLIYELLTGTQLFGVCLIGDDREEDADGDHLLELHDIIGELPGNIKALWPRAHKWFGINGERLNPRAKKHNDIEVEDNGENQDMNSEKLNRGMDNDNEEFEFDDMDEDGPDNYETEDEELFINDPLEILFERNKPDDIDTEEAGVVTALLRRILKYDASERPSTDELLKEKWFEDA